MAKRKATQHIITAEDIEKDPEVLNVQPDFSDVFEAKVKNLRSKGYDDNRIAAMLMTPKEKVQSIQ